MHSFLENFPNHILAVIMPDNKGENKIFHNISLEEASELNQLRKKGDIYFTPNGDYSLSFPDEKHLSVEKRTNKGRTVLNAKNVYAFIADIDSKDELRKNYEGLDKPSYVIETAHGHHLYYILEKPLSFEDYKKEFKEIEEKLVVLLRGDPKCTDISRILRVPTFKYWKDNKGEIEITIKEDNGTKFGFADIKNIVSKYYVSAGKDTEERKILTKKIKDRDIAKSFDDFFLEVQKIDVVDVLNDLFGSVYDVRTGGAIYEGGKRTDGYKYCKRGNFINTFSDNDRPTGGPYSVAKFYYKNTSDAIDYFTKTWGIEFKRFTDMKKILGDTTEELKPKDSESKLRQDIRYGTASNGIIIKFEDEKIIQYYDKGESEYVNGVVESYGFYKNNESTRYIVKTTRGGVSEIKTLPLIGGGSDLRKFLMSMGLIVGESKQGLIYLLKYLTSIKKEYLYTEKLGLQYINGRKVVVKKGGVYIDDEQNLFVNIPETTGEFMIIDEENTTSISQFVEQLADGYNGTISFVSFLTTCLGVNAYFFREHEVKLPQFFLMGLSQTGKALSGSTEIPLFDGSFKKIKDINEGDVIISGDGMPTKVVGKYNPKQKTVYRVTFKDGIYVDCCADHLRKVETNMGNKKIEVLSTQQLVDGGVKKGQYNHYRIAMNPIQYNKKQYILDPYTLGVWLGDGYSAGSRICIKKGDEEILNNIDGEVKFNAEERGCCRYGVFGLKSKLNKIGVLNNKHIPEEYLSGDINQRLDLLAGLLDTDGTVATGHSSAVSFSTSRKELAEGVKQLVNSLGRKYNLFTRIPTYSYNGEKKKGKQEYRISFFPNKDVFKLERQNKKLITKRNESKRFITSIEPIQKTEEYYCLSVDSDDHTFMCTRNYIKTHNTTYLENLLIRGLGLKMEIAASSKPFIYQKMAKHYLPIHFCEYRNTAVNKEEVEGQMRILFDGTEGTKGKSDQSVVYYPSNALYMLDGQATFTDDAVLTRLFLLIANPKDKGDLEKLETLPNIMNKVINIFGSDVDFKKYLTLCKKHRKLIKQSMTLSRENDRMIDNFSFLYGLSERLGLTEYNKYLDEAMLRQDGYLSLDDIKMTYQKCFNLQQIHKFSINIFGKGLVIEIIEEYLKSNNIADLKGMIKTVNQHFIIGEYPFIGMELYIDLEYIYKNKQLWNAFMRSLSFLKFSGNYTPDEYKSIGSLKSFVQENFSGSSLMEDLNIEFATAKPKPETLGGMF